MEAQEWFPPDPFPRKPNKVFLFYLMQLFSQLSLDHEINIVILSVSRREGSENYEFSQATYYPTYRSFAFGCAQDDSEVE